MQKRYPLRLSTLAERKEFYTRDFSVAKVKAWFKQNKMLLPQICALDAGSDSHILLNKVWDNTLFYFPFSELKEKVLQYLPEDIYYDRNRYADPRKVIKTLSFANHLSQELVFDVDADNNSCSKHSKERVCDTCIGEAYRAAGALQSDIKKLFNKTQVLYSGRGFHVHVFDRNAFLLSNRERGALNKRFAQYLIDPWVSAGHIHLIRLPFSLNALVSRRVTPLKNHQKFILSACIPHFLRA